MKTIYEILYGSRAYGTATGSSDNDIRGILLPTLEESLSMKPLKDLRVQKEKEDRIMYPIQKFFKLAIKSNPSVFEWLFVPPSCIYIMEEPAKLIRDRRDIFISQEAYHRFKGYAQSEFSNLTKLTGKTGAKRKKQILKYGYSPKNAMNCIRLIEQGIELLEVGTITFPRPNANALKQIKLGEWDYKNICRRFTERIEELDEAFKKSDLPENPQTEEADKLLIHILKNYA